jgi:hypothetical protein
MAPVLLIVKVTGPAFTDVLASVMDHSFSSTFIADALPGAGGCPPGWLGAPPRPQATATTATSTITASIPIRTRIRSLLVE